MKRLAYLTLLPSALLIGCTGGSGTNITEPSEMAEAIAKSVSEHGQVVPEQVPLAHGLFSLPKAFPKTEVNAENCQAVESLLSLACPLAASIGGQGYCYAQATYFLAHSTPRCAARLELSNAEEVLSTTYAFDLSGQPLVGPIDSCGNGVVDEDEECDDGNHEEWDGCDPTCKFEDFQGCEAVIEQYYQDAGLAFVDQDKWNGPRSHMMINPTALALTEVSKLSCDAAISLGVDVCNELMLQMPFVAGCQSMGVLRDEENEQRCHIRFQVNFQQVDPANGVFTTALPGILAFTIGS